MELNVEDWYLVSIMFSRSSLSLSKEETEFLANSLNLISDHVREGRKFSSVVIPRNKPLRVRIKNEPLISRWSVPTGWSK